MKTSVSSKIYFFVLMFAFMSCDRKESNLESFLKEFQKVERQCDGIGFRDCNLLYDKIKQFEITDSQLVELEKHCTRLRPRICVFLAHEYKNKNPKKYLEFLDEACMYSHHDACGTYGFEIHKTDKNKSIKILIESCQKNSSIACGNLGIIFHDDGKIDQSLKYFLKSCSLHSMNGCYNYSCVNSERGKVQTALITFEKALSLGFKDWNLIEKDECLKPIRETPEFKRLVDFYKKMNSPK